MKGGYKMKEEGGKSKTCVHLTNDVALKVDCDQEGKAHFVYNVT